MHYYQSLIFLHLDKFREDFAAWLDANFHISNVREISGEFKINNNRIQDLARLYMLEHPEQVGLFEFRGERKAA